MNANELEPQRLQMINSIDDLMRQHAIPKEHQLKVAKALMEVVNVGVVRAVVLTGDDDFLKICSEEQFEEAKEHLEECGVDASRMIDEILVPISSLLTGSSRQ